MYAVNSSVEDAVVIDDEWQLGFVEYTRDGEPIIAVDSRGVVYTNSDGILRGYGRLGMFSAVSCDCFGGET